MWNKSIFIEDLKWSCEVNVPHIFYMCQINFNRSKNLEIEIYTLEINISPLSQASLPILPNLRRHDYSNQLLTSWLISNLSWAVSRAAECKHDMQSRSCLSTIVHEKIHDRKNMINKIYYTKIFKLWNLILFILFVC